MRTLATRFIARTHTRTHTHKRGPMPPVTYGLVQQDESEADPSATVTLHVSRTADIIDRVTTRVALVVSGIASVFSVLTVVAVVYYTR